VTQVITVPTSHGGSTTITVPAGVTTVTITTTNGETETIHIPTPTPEIITTTGGHQTVILTEPSTQTPVVTEVVTTPNGGTTTITQSAPITSVTKSEVEEEFVPKPTWVSPPSTEVEEESVPTTVLTETVTQVIYTTNPNHPSVVTETVSEPTIIVTPNTEVTQVITVPTSHGGSTTITVPAGVTSVTITTTNGETETIHIPTPTPEVITTTGGHQTVILTEPSTVTPVVTEVVTTPHGGTKTITHSAPVHTVVKTEVEEEFVPKPTWVNPPTYNPTTSFTPQPTPREEEGPFIPTRNTGVWMSSSSATPIYHEENRETDEFTVIIDSSQPHGGDDLVVKLHCKETPEVVPRHSENFLA
jgi:type VI secretion system secreted protein VgrG